MRETKAILFWLAQATVDISHSLPIVSSSPHDCSAGSPRLTNTGHLYSSAAIFKCLDAKKGILLTVERICGSV
jgi:hypothetical protein